MMQVAVRSYPQEGRRMLFVLPPVYEEGIPFCPSNLPIMTATLVGQAIREKAHVGVIDAALLGVSQNDLVELIASWGADWIGFVPFEYHRECSLERTLSVISALRAIGCTAQMGVVNALWGALPPRRAMEKNELDFVAFGPSESAVQQFVHNPKKTPEGVLWNVHGYLEENISRPRVDWSDLAIPAWFLFDYNSYSVSNNRNRTAPMLPVLFSRLCTSESLFCPQSLFDTTERESTRTSTSVFSEIQILHRHYKVLDIEFYDPVFGTSRMEALALCRLLESVDVSWSCQTRCDVLDEEMISAMSKSGCHTILFTMEAQQENVESVFSLCQKYGVESIASYVLGQPKENSSSLRDTISFACELNSTHVRFQLPKAFFADEEWLRHGRIERNKRGDLYVPHGFSLGTLQKSMMRGYAQFYLRPSKIFQLTRSIRHRSTLIRYLRTISGFMNDVRMQY